MKLEEQWYYKRPIVAVKCWGKHSQRYLNSRLSNNIKDLKIGESKSAAALTAQGKVECIVEILALSEQEYLLTAFNISSEKLIEIIARYKVADQIELREESEFSKKIYIQTNTLQINELLNTSDYFKNTFKNIKIVTTKNIHLEALVDILTSKNIKQLSEAEFQIIRLRYLDPEFPFELNETRILTETNCENLLADQKGCYIGQEVVEKSRFVGKLPYQTIRVSSNSDITIFKVLTQNETTVGEILSSTYDFKEAKSYAFIRVRRALVDSNKLDFDQFKDCQVI